MKKYATELKKKQEECYKRLSLDEREEIAIGLEQDKSTTLIAREAGRNKGTISREIRRNKPSVYNYLYRANRAQVHSVRLYRGGDSPNLQSKRRHTQGGLFFEVKLYAENRLKVWMDTRRDSWKVPVDIHGCKTNHKSIYQWIYYTSGFTT